MDRLDTSAAILSLELSNTGTKWPALGKNYCLQNLETLRLIYASQEEHSETYYIWPDFEEIAKLSHLKLLEVFAEYSDDLPDTASIALLSGIEHLHIGIQFGLFPDLQPLQQMGNLRILEMSLPQSSLTKGLTGIGELKHVKTVKINLEKFDKNTNEDKDMISGIIREMKFLLPNCEILVL